MITALAFATSPTYFTHYGEFLGPAVALLVSRALDIRRGALIAIAFAVAFVIGTGVQLSDLRGQEDACAPPLPPFPTAVASTPTRSACP